MPANNTDQLQHSLNQVISMQLQELPQIMDPQSDEALARRIWQQELTTSRTEPASSYTPATTTARTRRSIQRDDRIASTPKPAQKIQHIDQDCSSCLDLTRGRNIVVLECCQTVFCKTCFRTWFETALNGKTLPSCCGGNVKLDSYGANLTAVLRKQYDRVEEELTADRKIYCGSSKCGKFIKIDENSPAFVQCRYCKCKTCTSCKDLISAHGKRKTCPNYLNDEELQKILNTNQWKRCPTCFAPVEKINGCNNVKCTCGSRFCFRCGDRKRSEGDRCSCNRDTMGQYTAGAAAATATATARPASWAAAVLPNSLARFMASGTQSMSMAALGQGQQRIISNDARQQANYASATTVVGQEQGQTQNASQGTSWSSAWSQITSWF